ncbi:MAG: DEAD/DEAH box helicase [Bacteroidales bacterium]
MIFEQFNFAAPVLKGIQSKGYSNATPVQQQAIPLMMNGKDVLVCAQTGTGKTAAFILPILHSLSENSVRSGIKALILTPTRELAVQIGLEIEKFARYTDIRYAVIIGGDSVEEQLYLTDRGVDILIATPGRLHHLQDRGLINLQKLEWLVVDEGDRMLDMGFIGVIRKIVYRLPRKRHSALFSATLQPDTIKLAKDILYRPAKINLVAEKPDLSLVSQTAYYVDKQNKQNLLIYLLKENAVESALIFVRTKYEAEKLAEALNKQGFQVSTLHGNKEQEDRHEAFRNFTSGQTNILVATDLAARGIDIPDLKYVFNFDLPNEPEIYLHRIGRTGRAGKKGMAISLCSNAELRFLKPIKKLVGIKNIQVIDQHPFSYAPREKGMPRQSAITVNKTPKND